MLGSKYWRAASVLVAGSMVLAACGQATPQVIKETVVVNVPHLAAAAVIHDEWITTRVGRGDDGSVSLDEHFGFWSWYL